jgi:hypothetical protein
MPNYQQSKIYKIVNDDDDDVYVGSTTKKYLCDRFANHKSHWRMYLNQNQKSRYCSSYQILGKANPRIELIEMCPCNNKDELLARERHHINNTVNCVNKSKNPGIMNEVGKDYNKMKCSEYYYSHYDELRARQNIYRLKNIEKIRAHKNKRVQCSECGFMYGNSCKGQHIRSKKHQNCLSVRIKRFVESATKDLQASRERLQRDIDYVNSLNN